MEVSVHAVLSLVGQVVLTESNRVGGPEVGTII